MSLKAKLEALIYAAEDPIGIDQMAALLKHDLLALKDQPAQPNQEDPENHLGAVEAERAEVERKDLPEAVADENERVADAPAAVEPTAEENVSGIPVDAQQSVQAPTVLAKKADKRSPDKSEKIALRNLLKPILEELIAEFNKEDHGIEIRQVAGGYRMSTKPEHHDVVRAFAKSLKPPIRLSLQALETLAVIAYKQPVTVPEISEIRGVDSSGVIGTLLERKLITTAGRKSVVGRPMLYKTTRDFLVRFGLSDIGELPSIEEFEKLAVGDLQEELFSAKDAAMPDATGIPGTLDENDEKDETDAEAKSDAPNAPPDGGVEQLAEDKAEVPQNMTEPTVSSDPQHTQADEEAANQIASESTGG
jgi:segregation and condensation protein B